MGSLRYRAPGVSSGNIPFSSKLWFTPDCRGRLASWTLIGCYVTSLREWTLNDWKFKYLSSSNNVFAILNPFERARPYQGLHAQKLPDTRLYADFVWSRVAPSLFVWTPSNPRLLYTGYLYILYTGYLYIKFLPYGRNVHLHLMIICNYYHAYTLCKGLCIEGRSLSGK